MGASIDWNSEFPWMTDEQSSQLEAYGELLVRTNEQINLISRKEHEHVMVRHVLHSLSIAKVVRFGADVHIADVGTGGGLPGIPLAIAFPEAQFTLIDSIGKKVNAVAEMSRELKLKNVKTRQARMEEVDDRFDFVVSRAVSNLPNMAAWLKGKIRPGKKAELSNGLIYIKGGDFQEELKSIRKVYKTWDIASWFDDPFFETKKVVWIDLAR